MSIYHSDSLPTISCHETNQTDKGLLGIAECVCDKACQYITSLPLMYAHTCTHQSSSPSSLRLPRQQRDSPSKSPVLPRATHPPWSKSGNQKLCNGLEWLCAIALHHVYQPDWTSLVAIDSTHNSAHNSTPRLYLPIQYYSCVHAHTFFIPVLQV